MLNILKFIYRLFQVCRTAKPAKDYIDKKLDDFEIVCVQSFKVDVDFKQVIYPNMSNEVCMGEWGEVIVSKPNIRKGKYNNLFLACAPHHGSKASVYDILNSLDYRTEVRLVEYVKNDKKVFVFFIIPTYALLYSLFAASFRLYVRSHLLSNYLEQLQETINYILHKAEVEINNVLFSLDKSIHLLILNFKLNGIYTTEATASS
ncbi:MAG: hypothetical protein J0M37_05905 [Ignavibacteria bacterium]|nr:hypothetical protein [Ignavibacteria bacterium]